MTDLSAEAAPESKTRRRHFPRFRWILLGAFLILVLLWLAPTITAFLADIDIEGLDRPYLLIFTFVVFDAIIPIFPSESLLTTASSLAAQDGSTLVLWSIIVAGALGATVGDSLLYWLSRTVLRRFVSDRVEQAEQNEKVARSMEVLSGNAPLLIVVGRFVPGMRFVVGATMGLTRYNYPRFLLYDAIGGTLWAAYTCIFSFLVGSIIDDKPVLSIAISVIVTTGLLGLLYKPMKHSWEATASDAEVASETP
jgi:membrane protein DedA with SNARE-associated domain